MFKDIYMFPKVNQIILVEFNTPREKIVFLGLPDVGFVFIEECSFGNPNEQSFETMIFYVKNVFIPITIHLRYLL